MTYRVAMAGLVVLALASLVGFASSWWWPIFYDVTLRESVEDGRTIMGLQSQAGQVTVSLTCQRHLEQQPHPSRNNLDADQVLSELESLIESGDVEVTALEAPPPGYWLTLGVQAARRDRFVL